MLVANIKVDRLYLVGVQGVWKAGMRGRILLAPRLSPRPLTWLAESSPPTHTQKVLFRMFEQILTPWANEGRVQSQGMRSDRRSVNIRSQQGRRPDNWAPRP